MSGHERIALVRSLFHSLNNQNSDEREVVLHAVEDAGLFFDSDSQIWGPRAGMWGQVSAEVLGGSFFLKAPGWTGCYLVKWTSDLILLSIREEWVDREHLRWSPVCYVKSVNGRKPLRDTARSPECFPSHPYVEILLSCGATSRPPSLDERLPVFPHCPALGLMCFLQILIYFLKILHSTLL